MPFRKLPYNFHDSQLLDFCLGPRKEVTLEIALDPVWNEGVRRTVQVRLGAIQNFDEVTAYFGRIVRPKQSEWAMAEVIGLTHSGDRKDRVMLDLSPGGSVEVQSRHLDVV